MSCECRTTVLTKHEKTSRLSGEKIKLSDIHTNVVRQLHECRATRTNENENKLHSWESHETFLRMSHDCCATVARLSHDSREIYFQN